MTGQKLTKPKTIADAGNGAIVQGRPDDVGVIQVGKTADFRTAAEQMSTLERKLQIFMENHK